MPRGKKKSAEGQSDEVLAALLNPSSSLSAFEGQEVIGCAVELPNAGGGLQEPLAFEPVEFHHGEEGYMLVHWRCKKVRFDEVKDTEALKRVHVFTVKETTLVGREAAEPHFVEQRERLQKLRDEAKGLTPLPFGDGDGFFDPGEGGYDEDSDDDDE